MIHKNINDIFTVVKTVNFILSIYLIVLSCLPCVDMEQDIMFDNVTIHNQSNHHQDNHFCSPLCICNCCSSQSFVYNPIYNFNFIPVKILIDKKNPEYKSILTSNFFGSIWQPPQIA
jgi:hypothetical protein